ncbi:peptidase M6 [Streptomyces sp. AJS327]|uniref:peptidase M6 n=1 Tax=Streptomyces sp. AJS327 TaxID=2545265 RepID=UPI0015DF8549|nr:peptidase M6 [Streptomyces sp. AJS327]MBA0050343.1 peptidase M6 [Streptomyces sp. AJS327]
MSTAPSTRRSLPRRAARHLGTLLGTTALLAAGLALAPVPSSAAEGISGPCGILPGDGGGVGPRQPGAPRPVGRQRPALLLVDFPDRLARTPPAQRAAFFTGYAGDQLRQASYGALRLGFHTSPGWLRMPRPWSAYGLDRGSPPSVVRAYVRDAVDAARAAGAELGDTGLVFVVADTNVPASPSVSQAHLFGDVPHLAGGPVRGAALIFGRQRDDPAWQRGNFVHEAHHLHGLPDLYNAATGASVEYAGGWDTMSLAGVSDLLGWHKWKLGWLAGERVGCSEGTAPSEHRLAPVTARRGTALAVARTGPHTAVVAEARTRTGRDRGICAEGVLLYTVDSRVASGAGPVRVVDSRPGSLGGPACAGRGPAEHAELADAPFQPGEHHTFPGGVTVRILDGPGHCGRPDSRNTRDDCGYRVRVTKS